MGSDHRVLRRSRRSRRARRVGPAGHTGTASSPSSTADAYRTWTIDVDSRPITIQPLRLAVEPTLLGAQDLEQIGDLYGVAMDESGATSDEAPYADLDITADRPPPTLAERLRPLETVSVEVAPPDPDGPAPHRNGNGRSAPLSGRRHPISVSILGTVEIEGAKVFKRAKSRELAVYLALHPNGVGEAELDEALWPSANGRLVAASTRDSTVSVARTALGGPTRLLPAQGHGREKRYQVSDDVGTDWSLFCRFHRDGRAAEDPSLLGPHSSWCEAGRSKASSPGEATDGSTPRGTPATSRPRWPTPPTWPPACCWPEDTPSKPVGRPGGD